MPIIYREPAPVIATVPGVGTVPSVPTSSTTTSLSSVSSVHISSTSPYQTSTPLAQGSVKFYQGNACIPPLNDLAYPLSVGSCLNAPSKGIKGVSISALPSCSDNGTPMLIVSNVANCGSSTIGSSADGGNINWCQSFSSGADIGSVELVCVTSSLSKTSAATSKTTTTKATSTTPYYTFSSYTSPSAAGYLPIPTVYNGGSSSSYTTPPSSSSSGSCCGCGSGCCCCCTVM